MPPSKGLPPGEAASLVRDSDLVGSKLVDCLRAAARYRMTPRQRDVLFLSLCEKCPKDVARKLQLRTGYVRVVLQAVVRKLRVTDGMHGIRWRLAEIARERENGGGGKTLRSVRRAAAFLSRGRRSLACFGRSSVKAGTIHCMPHPLTGTGS